MTYAPPLYGPVVGREEMCNSLTPYILIFSNLSQRSCSSLTVYLWRIIIKREVLRTRHQLWPEARRLR
jgi:hypothetical protein